MAKRLRRLPWRSDIGLPCSFCLAASPAGGRFASAGEKSHPCPSQFLPGFVYIVREDEVKFFGFGAQLNGRLGYRCILSWFAACRGVLTSQGLAGFGCRPALRAVASLLQAKNLAPALVSSCRGLFTSRGDEVKFFGLDGRFASAGEKLHLVPNLFNPWRAGCGRGGHRPSGGLRSRAGWLWGR